MPRPGPDAETEGIGRLQRIDHMEIMREGLCPILVRMRAGISADMVLLPMRHRAVLVIGLKRLGIVPGLVAKGITKNLVILATGHEKLPIIMRRLVSEMAQ